MSSLFDRLREQRDAIGLSQQALADACGISLRSQQNYEKGLRSPDADYLVALHRQEIDVLYILTGQHDPAAPMLNAAERVLLDSYRRCRADGRAHLIQTAALLSAGLPLAGVTQGSSVGGTHTSSGAGAVHMGQVSGVGVRTGKSKK